MPLVSGTMVMMKSPAKATMCPYSQNTELGPSIELSRGVDAGQLLQDHQGHAHKHGSRVLHQEAECPLLDLEVAGLGVGLQSRNRVVSEGRVFM